VAAQQNQPDDGEDAFKDLFKMGEEKIKDKLPTTVKNDSLKFNPYKGDLNVPIIQPKKAEPSAASLSAQD